MNLLEQNRADARLRREHSEMLAALKGVLSAYKDYGKLATRDSEEYTSLTAVRRAIRNATAPRNPYCGLPIIFAGGASGGDMTVPCMLKPKHRGACAPLLSKEPRKKKAAPRKIADPFKGKDWSWQCNECGSDEYTSGYSEEDLEKLACGNCGANEFHKVEVSK